MKRLLVLFLLLAASLMLVGCQGATETETAVSETALSPERSAAMQTAVDWMVRTQQKADGGYSNFGGDEADIPSTLDAILALSAAGSDPAAPLAYLQANADDLIAYAGFGGGAAGKIILSLVAAGESPREFANFNFVSSLTGQLGDDGRYNAEVAFDQALALLALASVREPIPSEAAQWLKDQQGPDGAWSDGYGTDSNADATGAAIMALVASGEAADSDSLSRARAFLAAAQLPSGGWEYGPGYGESTNSTALAMQGLIALGEDVVTVGGAWDKEGNTPLSALLAWQGPEGAFQADFGDGRFDNQYATVQSIPAVAGKALPLVR